MNQQRHTYQNEAQRYALFGILFGALFPIVATLIRVASANLPFSFSGILQAQTTDPLLWIIDTAPIFLGFLASFAGRRQDNFNKRNEDLLHKEDELKGIQATLEQRVAERTRELEEQSRRLLVAAEIARDAASSRDLGELLERAGRLVQERFGYYHTGIFLLDKRKEFAVLMASPTEAGKQMIVNNHKLRVGEVGIVGRVASTGEPRITLDTGLDAVHFNNPLLPNTRSEMALPLKVENTLIGVLDVQSEQPQAFNRDDITILQALADQLANAIERTRLMQQQEQNLRELEQAYGRTTRHNWKSLAESGLLTNSGYRFDNVRIQPINDIPELGNEALQSGNVVMHGNGKHATDQELIAIPIKLRGQSVGVVTAKLKKGYSPNTVDTIKQAVERLALSLESARLYEEARLRADREQAIAQVTSGISSASEFDAILRTTVEEIGRTLGDSEVSIQLVGGTSE